MKIPEFRLSTEEDWAKQLLRLLARHFVSLILIHYSRTNAVRASKGECFIVSGFLLSVRRRLFLATAGHVLRIVDSIIAEHDVRQSYLYAGWSMPEKIDGKTVINLQHCPRWYVDDDASGLDIGLISLNDYYAENLIALQALPLIEEMVRSPAAQYDQACIVGLPSEGIEVEYSATGIPVATKVKPTILFLEPVASPPQPLIKTTPRFYGRLIAPATSRGDHFAIVDIEGMSGGAVFGMGVGADGNPILSLIGVQSGWLKGSRIVAACPMKELIDKMIQQYDQWDMKPKIES